MPHRAHLFSLRMAHAFREACIDEPYRGRRFLRDVMAGLTVGIIAIPLAMALAIASGVAPQYGLYTAIIAGFVIALTGYAKQEEIAGFFTNTSEEFLNEFLYQSTQVKNIWIPYGE